ncbi:integral membrane protein [Colletotrichum plurivorum]|uniref:Integral membrane protein n=1 Tax=Colletotrichum plurivorum TaxID=2175906 RepID=A0A8H6KN60_9PEZI|nr:integral membrane protein [Colletotrichum plurivorum]
MMCLTTLVISVRMGVRASLRTYGVDDMLIRRMQVFTMTMCTITLVSTHTGFGKHHQDVSPSQYVQFLKMAIPTSSTYSYGLALAKMSFAVLYIRMLPERHLIIMNKIITGFLCCQAVEESLLPIFQCQPIAKAWTPGMPGRCIDLPVLWWCGFAFNLCTDFMLFIQPMPTLWKLQLPIIKRLGLIAMLSLGLMVCAISIIRMHSVTQMGLDDIHDLAVPILWSEAEVSTLIVCSCVPSLRKAAQKVPWFKRLFETTSVDSQVPQVETIGHIRRKGGGKDRGDKSIMDPESGLTGTTATHPMSVLSRTVDVSHAVNEDTEEIVRTTTGSTEASWNPQWQNIDLEANAETKGLSPRPQPPKGPNEPQPPTGPNEPPSGKT